MLTPDEEKYIAWWEIHRNRKKKYWRQLAIGLPVGTLIALAVFLNFFSGWYKRADMMIRSQSTLILVILVAALLIVLFMVIFSARHQWEMNEQRYREYVSRKNDSG